MNGYPHSDEILPQKRNPLVLVGQRLLLFGTVQRMWPTLLVASTCMLVFTGRRSSCGSARPCTTELCCLCWQVAASQLEFFAWGSSRSDRRAVACSCSLWSRAMVHVISEMLRLL